MNKHPDIILIDAVHRFYQEQSPPLDFRPGSLNYGPAQFYVPLSVYNEYREFAAKAIDIDPEDPTFQPRYLGSPVFPFHGATSCLLRDLEKTYNNSMSLSE